MQNVSVKAASLIGSEIIRLGNEINRKIREGQQIYNLTIGDFNPAIFPIPELLKDEIIKAYQEGHTNYPPADGIPELKLAIRSFIKDFEKIDFADDEVMVAGGGRPLIYAIYSALIDPGDKVVYPVPSWNNNHYCHLTDAVKEEVQTFPENGFMPTADSIQPHIEEAVLLALCSPLNPTGTTFRKEELEKICKLVLDENKRREGIRKPLYVLYDQMYWMLRQDGIEHVNPVSLFPEMKRYTVFVDGISKSLAATGVRVGWSMGPSEVISKMKSILGHVGAWSPKAEQEATARFLKNTEALNNFLLELKEKVTLRFDSLYNGFEALRAKGMPVRVVKPEGAIYITLQFDVLGKTDANGKKLESTQDITDFLLNQAGIALVPFTAFGAEKGTNWFRLSIGTLPANEISELMQKFESALSTLS